MGAPYNPPIKGEDFVVYVALSDLNVPGAFKAAPTIVAGDFKVDKDGAGLVNLTAVPVVTPAGSVLVKITLTATEMNADVVTIVGIDLTAPKEWADFVLSIPTTGPGDIELLALAGLTSAADQVPFFTGSGAASTATASLFSRGLWANTTAALWQSALGLSAVYQVLDPTLTAFAGITGAFNAADKVPYFTGTDAFTTTTLSPFARTLIDDLDAPGMRGTLLLGTAATQNTGTVGATIPILNVANTWDAVQAFKQGSTHGGSVTTGRMATFANDGTLSLRYGNNSIQIPLALINTQPAATTLAYQIGMDFRHGAGEFIGARILSNPTADYTTTGTASATLFLQYANAGALVSGLSVGASLVTILQPLQVSSTMAVTGAASFTVGPTGPTAAPGANTLQLATTAFVTAAVGAVSTVYQPLDPTLTAFAAVTGAPDRLPYFTAFDVFGLATFTLAGRNLVDDIDNVAQRVTLGLGSAAIQNIGTSGATVPLLSTANTWTLTQSFIPGPDIEAVRAGRSAAQSILLFSGAAGGNNSLVSNSSAAAAKPFIINATTDMANSAITGGSVSINFQVLGIPYLQITNIGILTSGVAGGAQGVGTFNADTLFEGGVALSTKYQGTGSYQPLDPTLTAFAAITGAANTIPYFTALDAFALTSFTSYGRQLVDDADATAARATLGLVIGTDVQPYSATLTAWATKAVPTGVVVGTTDAQVLTSKSIDASANTISNITTTMFAPNVIDADSGLSANSNTRLPTQAAVKSYADNIVTGLSWKPSVLVATTANLTLAGEQTIDGVLTSASRVLVKNQTTASQNGIYISAAGSWVRSNDTNTGIELVSATVFVERGTVNGDTQWTCSNDTITLGTTNIVFSQVSGAGTYSAGTGLTLTGNQFSISDAELVALLGTTAAADQLPYFTSATAATTTTLSLFSRTLLDDTSATAWRATLLLGTAAVADTGTSLHTIPFLDTFNTWSAAQVITLATASAVPLALISTEAAGAAGPYLDLFRNSISPAVNDQIGIIRFRGQNSAAASITYGDALTQIIDFNAGTETSKMFFRNYVKGVQNNTLVLDSGGGIIIDEALLSPMSTGSTNTTARLAYNLVSWRGGSTTVGAIVFHAPTTAMANMHRFRVLGYAHTTNLMSIDFTVSGYHATTGGAWSPAEAQHFGTNRPMVRWGQDQFGCNCLIIGDVATSITWGNIAVVEAMVSHTVVDAYMQGWTVSVETDLSTYVAITADLTLTEKGSQPLDPTLTAFAGVVGAANMVPYFTGLDAFSTTSLSPFARTLIDDLDAPTMRTTLGLGSAALAATGTSAHTVPFLDGTNAWSAPQTITVATTSLIPLTLVSTDPSNLTGPYLILHRDSASPLAGDILGEYRFNGDDSLGNATAYGGIRSAISNATDGAEAGVIEFITTQAGSYGIKASIGAGLYTYSVAGGDQGSGTINASILYEAGVSLAAKYAALGGSSFTGNITTSGGNIITTGGYIMVDRQTDAATAVMYIQSDPSWAGQLQFRTLASPRWILTKTATAESGSNAGSDFQILRYDDLGGPLTPVLTINRANATATYAGLWNVSGGIISDRTGDALTAYFTANSDVNYASQLGLYSGTPRWLLYKDTTAESGGTTGAVGANFSIRAYDNSGGYLFNPIFIYRSTGVVQFYTVPTVGGVPLAQTNVDNNFTAAQTITIPTVSAAALRVVVTESGALTGPYVILQRESTTPAANDILGELRFNGNDSIGGLTAYGGIRTVINSATDGAEASKLDFITTYAGSYSVRVAIAQGLYGINTTGGDMGGGTANFTTLYESGVSLAAKYAPISGSLTSITTTGSITSTGGNIIATGGYIMVDRAGDLATSVLYIQGDNLWSKQLQFRTGISARWTLMSTTTAESGTAVGSDLQLIRYDNSANSLGAVLTVTRSTGNATFSGGVTATGALTATAGGLAVDRRGDLAGANIYMYADVNYGTQITLYGGSAARWVLWKNTTAEGGGTTGNIGADFEIRSYNNDGSSHGIAMNIPRTSNIVNFPSGISTTGNITNTGGIIDIDRRGGGGSAIMRMRSDSLSASYIYFDGDDGTLRWLIGKNTAAETGDISTGTGGANFVIYAYDNNGANARNAVAIYRDSLETHFAGAAFAPTAPIGDDSTQLATTGWVHNERQVLNPQSFGALADGVTNDQDALQRCIDACPAGGVVDGRNKKYKVNKTSNTAVFPIVLKANMTLRNIEIDATGIGVNGSLTNDGILFSTTGGSESSNKTITGTANSLASVVSLSSTDVAFFAVDDWVIVESNDPWDNATNPCFLSEIHQIKSKPSSTSIAFYDSLKFTFNTSASPRIRKITTVKNLQLINVKATGNNTNIRYDPDLPYSLEDNPYQGQWGGQFFYCLDLVIQDCDFSKFADRCFAFYMCINTNVRDNTIGSCLDDYAYGIQIQSGSYSTRVTNNRFWHCHHGVDFGDDEGVNRNTIIQGNTFTQMRGGGIDAHAATDDCLIDGNIIEVDSSDTSVTAAIYYKGANVSITSNRITGPPNDGILISDKTIYPTRCKVLINGNTIWDVGGGQCIYVMKEGVEVTGTTSTPMESIIITGNDIRHRTGAAGTHGMRIRTVNAPIDEVSIVGNKIRGPQLGIYLQTDTQPIGKAPAYLSSAVVNSNLIRCSGSNPTYGIYFYAEGTSPISVATIVGNQIISSPAYGCYTDGVNNVILTANHFKGCATPSSVNASYYVIAANLV